VAPLQREFPKQWRTQTYVDEIGKTFPYPIYSELKFYGISLGLIVAHAIDLISFSTFVGAFFFYTIACQILVSRMNHFLATVLEGLAGDLAAVDENLKSLEQRLASIDKGLESELQNLENGLSILDSKLESMMK